MDEDALSQQEFNRLMEIRLSKLKALLSSGQSPYAYSFERKNDAEGVKRDFSSVGHEPSEEEVSLAGRIMSVRDHGKSCFMSLQDRSGSIQIYAREDRLGTERFSSFKELDAGDIIGIRGCVFRTRKGEITVEVTHFELLSKSIRPLPEKYHGLRDVEMRYRMRYVDLIVNANSMRTFMRRSYLISAIRRWLDQRGFIEVETPVLTPLPGGASARPFVTHYNYLDQDFYLRIATELYLKRLIVGGMEKVYEIGKDFRNEDMDTTHNPEFTMLELYQAYSDYTEIMELTENMLSSAIEGMAGNPVLEYQGKQIDFTPPWRRMSMVEAIEHEGGIELPDLQDREALFETGRRNGIAEIDREMRAGEIIAEIFEQRVEERLLQPTVIYDFPAEVSPLAKRKRGNPAFAERFEVFVNGFEIANAFSELNSPFEQRENFEGQQKKRVAGDEEAHPFDTDYITALEYGLPPTGGLGVGIDRVAMLLTNSPSIKDVMLFPQMRRKEQL